MLQPSATVLGGGASGTLAGAAEGSVPSWADSPLLLGGEDSSDSEISGGDGVGSSLTQQTGR